MKKRVGKGAILYQTAYLKHQATISVPHTSKNQKI